MRMRIARARAWKEDLELTTPYRIAGERIGVAVNAFLVVETEDGYKGIGSGSAMPEVSGETTEETMAALHRLADALEGRDFDRPESWHPLLTEATPAAPAARSAADIALYDAFCQQTGQTIAAFLGQKHEEMHTSVTIGITSFDESRERLMHHLANGFSVIKLKIGDELDKDIAMVHKIREWGGHDFALRVDANQGYDPDQLRRFVLGTGDCNVELIEQPLKSPGADAMAVLPEGLRRICMADEDLISEQDAAVLSARDSYGLWNIKLMKSGGITSASRIAGMAAQKGIDLMWGCNDESRVSIAAALHVAFSARQTRWLDLDGSFDIAHDVVEGGFTVRNGVMRLTGKPGLGVSPLRDL